MSMAVPNLCHRALSQATYGAHKQVLDVLHHIVLKLPVPVLEHQAEFLFLPLVLRVVQDPAAKCRAAAGTVTKLLLRRVGRKKCQVCWGCSERAPEAALT